MGAGTASYANTLVTALHCTSFESEVQTTAIACTSRGVQQVRARDIVQVAKASAAAPAPLTRICARVSTWIRELNGGAQREEEIDNWTLSGHLAVGGH